VGADVPPTFHEGPRSGRAIELAGVLVLGGRPIYRQRTAIELAGVLVLGGWPIYRQRTASARAVLERRRWRSSANARAGDRRGGVAIGSQGAGGLRISNHDRRGDLATIYDFERGAAACIVGRRG
jgi:hypothetical protein